MQVQHYLGLHQAGFSIPQHKIAVLSHIGPAGDIISDLCAGLIGGLGLTPSGNIGMSPSVPHLSLT